MNVYDIKCFNEIWTKIIKLQNNVKGCLNYMLFIECIYTCYLPSLLFVLIERFIVKFRIFMEFYINFRFTMSMMFYIQVFL